MKKVGILSMQRIANYGSYMQAFGLKKIVESFDCEVMFVDYRIGKPVIQGKSMGKIKKLINLFKQPGKISHKLGYLKFKKSYRNYLIDINIDENYLYNPKLDLLIVGSDEVFNCIQANVNVGYSLDLFGKDSNADKKISYAASFGNTTYDKICKYGKKEELKKYLSQFDDISVRDENSYNVVKSLCDISSSINIDPVLLYSFKKEISSMNERPIKDKYIIVYGYTGRFSKEENKIIKDYAKRNKFKVISLGGVQKCADYYINCPPVEVLKYFKFAEGVFTDTFHGTIFSVICKNKFITIVRKSKNESYGNEEKLSYLLKTLSLNKMIYYNLKDFIDFDSIDYHEVDNILDVERTKALNYLRRNIIKED